MAAANYGDVLDQLRAAGLQVDSIDVGDFQRCRVVDGGHEKRGWYYLHEVTTDAGELVIVGTFGVWRGNDSGTQQITLTGRRMSAEQREAIKARAAADRKRADAKRRQVQESAARRAEAAWRRYSIEGDSPYLASKGVQGFGIRYTPGGSAVVPVMDVAGRVHGLQFLRTPAQAAEQKRPRKEFWPSGMAKQRHFHLIGMPSDIVFVAEGYATGASVHQATSGMPVAVAFDAGNLLPVATALRDRYKRARIVIVADDDCFTDGNPGVTSAHNAALAVDGSVFVPRWPDDAARQQRHADGKGKLTDANDLACSESLALLSSQIEAHLAGIGYRPGAAARVVPTTKGAGRARLTPILDLTDMLDRFALVYGHGGSVFDGLEHRLVTLSDMRDACARRELHRAWMEHPARRIVRPDEIGFDPAERDSAITCNLWSGWPTEPVAGDCTRLLGLIEYLCSAERHPAPLLQWVLRWLAYPLQHPGAKMRSALVFHGLQGTGKNLFFETVMQIYGKYGGLINQDAVEDKFNDWASAKLFFIADEVVARSEVYHIKNKLKGLITGEWIRINPKNVAAYQERNHVNLVFLSNEDMPVSLEKDDRRHGVIWTPAKQPDEYYAAIRDELDAGGAAALHHYLLHLDLGDFNEHTKPPETDAKNELIGLGLDNTSRFGEALIAGEFGDNLWAPALYADVYELYKLYVARIGERPARMARLQNHLKRHFSVVPARKRYMGAYGSVGPHSIAMMGSCPAGKAEGAWIGEGVEAFAASLKDFRGSTSGGPL